MRTVLATPPAAEPVTLAEAKVQLRVDSDEHDVLIASLIVAARVHLEQITNRAFIQQGVDLYLDDFPASREIELPRPPLLSVSGIFYTPDGADETTLSPASYLVDTVSQPGRIVLASGASWPGNTLTPINGVRFRYMCGFGSTVADVPVPLRQALLLLVGQWYDNPVTYEVGPVMPIPFAVDALIAPYRVVTF